MEKSKGNYRRETCNAGHKFTAENTCLKKIGQRTVRNCKACEAIRLAKRGKVCPGVTCEMLERKKILAEAIVKTQSDVLKQERRELVNTINAARAAVGGAI